MTALKEYIKSKRPKLGDSSVITYNSILKNLYKHVFGPGEIDVKKFDETEPVLKHLKELPAGKRKTILSALVIITDDKKYRDLMLKDIKEYTADISKQEKTEAQKENWVTAEDINSLWDQLRHNADLLYKKTQLTSGDLQQIQSYIIISLLGGIFIPPRRSLDYVNFKTKDIDREKDNYLDKKDLLFNSYKTSKTYGEQRVGLPPVLKSILTKWIKVNPTPYLLFDTNMGQLSSVKLNQRLNKLFGGKKIGINALRHSYLTDKYAASNNALANDMKSMGSSINMATTYIKND